MYFFFNDPATTEIYTLSLHDALPIYRPDIVLVGTRGAVRLNLHFVTDDFARQCLDMFHCPRNRQRSEEHTSELQSRFDLVCRLLLEKKKNKNILHTSTITF